MKSEFKLNRAWRYSLICGVTGAAFGFIMAASWFPNGADLFGISVFVGVTLVARLAHRMNLNEERLYGKREYFTAAIFVGLASHISSFFIFGILLGLFNRPALFYNRTGFSDALLYGILFGLLSMILLFWFSITLYMVTGLIAKKFDDKEGKESGYRLPEKIMMPEEYNEKLDF